jgi:hypothetical protein
VYTEVNVISGIYNRHFNIEFTVAVNFAYDVGPTTEPWNPAACAASMDVQLANIDSWAGTR